MGASLRAFRQLPPSLPRWQALRSRDRLTVAPLSGIGRRMLAKAFLSCHRALVLLAVMVALTATGFAHRVPFAEDDAAAYALANGVPLADLCAGDLDDDGQRKASCLACQITGSADLPPASPGLIDLELAFVARVISPRESRAVATVLDPSHAPQAPPVA
jgi:hypothetical protein